MAEGARGSFSSRADGESVIPAPSYCYWGSEQVLLGVLFVSPEFLLQLHGAEDADGLPLLHTLRVYSVSHWIQEKSRKPGIRLQVS